MKKAEAKKIVRELRAMESDAEVLDGYQTRGSYGETTTAIRCESLIDVGRALERTGIEGGVAWESLGLGYVVW